MIKEWTYESAYIHECACRDGQVRNACFLDLPAYLGCPFKADLRVDMKATMIYTHVLNRGSRGVVSPIDRLGLA